MQCERRAAREKRANVNPWLSGSTSGPWQGCPLLLAPAHRPRPAAAGLPRAVRAPGGAPGVAALGAGADFYFAYVQPGASRAPSRPCNCKVTQPGTGAAASARTRRRPGQGEARATPQPRGARAAATPAAREREEREGREGRGSAPVSARRPSAARPSRSSAAAVLVLEPAPQRRRATPAAGRHLPAAATDVRASPALASPRLPPSFPPSPVTYITPWEGRLEHGCRGE